MKVTNLDSFDNTRSQEGIRGALMNHVLSKFAAKKIEDSKVLRPSDTNLNPPKNTFPSSIIKKPNIDRQSKSPPDFKLAEIHRVI